jgi:rare lipoprotein A
MKILLLAGALILATLTLSPAATQPNNGVASWYGEAHRGKLMANGDKFDPDQLTAASWFFPLGTKVRVTTHAPDREDRTVTVTIPDRGPAWRLVRRKRIIDLTEAAFKELAHPDLGLVHVKVRPER